MRSSKVYKQKRTDRKRLRSLHFEVKEERSAKGTEKTSGKGGKLEEQGTIKTKTGNDYHADG